MNVECFEIVEKAFPHAKGFADQSKEDVEVGSPGAEVWCTQEQETALAGRNFRKGSWCVLEPSGR